VSYSAVIQPPSPVGSYALRATRSVEEAVCLSPHLPGPLDPAGIGTSRRAGRRRLPRLRRASSLHRSRCGLALELDAKTRRGAASREIYLFWCNLCFLDEPGQLDVRTPRRSGTCRVPTCRQPAASGPRRRGSDLPCRTGPRRGASCRSRPLQHRGTTRQIVSPVPVLMGLPVFVLDVPRPDPLTGAQVR
jgi:hypothetical protein